MKSNSINTVVYNPGDPGGISSFPDLVRFLREENIKLANAVRMLADGHLDEQSTPPARPRRGDLRLSDGIGWDPLVLGVPKMVWYNGATWQAF